MMLSLRLASLLLSFATAIIQAAPVQEDEAAVLQNLTSLETQADIPPIILSTAEIASYKPYTFYAAVPGCGPQSILAWNCGSKCSANPTFTPIAAGGDGALVQFWFVGHDSALDTVIVSFQGTDGSKILPLLRDADFFLRPLDSDRFPGVSSSIKTHSDFADAQVLSADDVISAVRTTLSRFGTSHVTVVGHSLGGAIAMISGIHLKTNLPSNITFKLVTYGCPRVGNQAFADYIDENFPGVVARIANKKDVVPILPGRFLGFHHVQGELHILNDLSWDSCPGQDNTNANCLIGYVPNIFVGTLNDHDGPYDGVTIGCSN